jgi:TRAP-type mannitol/chloroaromatic compound transport system permease small subunit
MAKPHLGCTKNKGFPLHGVSGFCQCTGSKEPHNSSSLKTRRRRMGALVKFANFMDWLSDTLGKFASWLVLFAAMICAGNAFVRYGLSWSSNSLLEIQWYMFAWIVMVGAPYVLKHNEHVRVDLIYGKLGGKKPVWIDIFGLVFFLLPVIGLLAYLSWPYFLKVLTTGEMSQNAGGLIRWPAVLALPVGFGVLWLQGVAELCKRIAFLGGQYQMDTHYEKPVQ